MSKQPIHSIEILVCSTLSQGSGDNTSVNSALICLSFSLLQLTSSLSGWGLDVSAEELVVDLELPPIKPSIAPFICSMPGTIFRFCTGVMPGVNSAQNFLSFEETCLHCFTQHQLRSCQPNCESVCVCLFVSIFRPPRRYSLESDRRQVLTVLSGGTQNWNTVLNQQLKNRQLSPACCSACLPGPPTSRAPHLRGPKVWVRCAEQAYRLC